MPAQIVRPYVKSNKNDFVDAEIQQNPLLERHEPGAADFAPHQDVAGETMTPTASTEALTEFTSEAIEYWQSEWADDAADRWRRYSVEQGASVSGQDVQPNRTRESRRGTL